MNGLKSVSLPAKAAHPGFTSSPDLISALLLYTCLNITWHVCSQNVKYLHKSIMERREQLVELSGLSSGKVERDNLNKKRISSTSNNPAIKQPIYSSEKGPLSMENLERPGIKRLPSCGSFPQVKHYQLSEGDARFQVPRYLPSAPLV